MFFSSLINQINTAIASVIRWFSLMMVITTMVIVVLRYVFETGAIAFQELVMYLHGFMFLLGIPYGVHKQSHVRVDMIYNRLSQQAKAYVDLLGHIIFLLPTALFIFWVSLPYVHSSWQVLEGSSEVGGLPFIYILKTTLPIFAALLVLQALSEIVQGVQQLRSAPITDE